VTKIIHVHRVKEISVNYKSEWQSPETDKQQDESLTAFIDSIADLNIKAGLEDKLRELDSKNDTMHVSTYIV